ncbi:Dyp-type peroxidase family protein [gamma proteobacterium HTCC5015]|nr:Dyp-type peroxidase family protein [gamma proteobacterium HTCC5015]
MNTAQSGILPTPNSHAYLLCLSAKEPQSLQWLLRFFHREVSNWSQRFPRAQLSGVIAIGSEAWERVFNGDRPDQLRAFPELENNDGKMPHTPFDVLIHLRSERHDINFELARELIEQFGQDLTVEKETHAFRYLDSRDLTGFVDGTENPEGEHRAEVALTPGNDALSQGSYIHLQHYLHNLPEWETMDIEEQEAVYGRTKIDDVEFDKVDKQATAHTLRANLKNDDGSPVELLRHSLPFGTVREYGLVFIAYAHRGDNFPRILRSMVEGDGHGHTDKLLQFTQAVTGASFFAPPVEFLEDESHYR